MRIAGINIPDQKRIDIALTYVYGIGRNNVYDFLTKVAIDPARRAKDLSEDEIGKIQKALDEVKVEGELRAQVLGDIKRLKDTGSYRGSRHARNLPARGQRTRSNARTKRGKRVTIGAIKKEVAEKMGLSGAGSAAAKK